MAKREKYVTVSWVDATPCTKCASVGARGYHEGNYPASQVPWLLARLHAAGVASALVNDVETDTNVQSIAQKGV